MPFSETTLRSYLENHLEGLNNDYVNVDIIVAKVASGIYNGKSSTQQPVRLVAVASLAPKLSYKGQCGALKDFCRTSFTYILPL